MNTSKNFKLIPVAVLVLRKGNSVLLARRCNTGWSDGLFALPAGHVEENETVFNAAIREGEEELGIRLQRENLEIVHIFHHKGSIKNREYLGIVAQATTWEGEPHNAEPEKCDHIEWFEQNNLPKNKMIHDDHEVLLHLTHKKVYSEHNWDFLEEHRKEKPFDRFALTAYVTLVLRKGDQILFTRRFNTGWGDGFYSLAGGRVDGNEPLYQTGVREAQEELGIKLKPESINLIHTVHVNEKGKQALGFYVEVTAWEGEPQNMEPHKCDQLAWFSINALPENLVYIQKHVFEQIKNKRFYSELGW